MKRIVALGVELLINNVTYEKDGVMSQKRVAVDVIDPDNPKFYFQEGEYDGEMEDILSKYLETLGLLKIKKINVEEGYLMSGLPGQPWNQ